MLTGRHRPFESLRARILLAVGLLALVAIGATGMLVFGISAATTDIARAAAANRRIELLGNLAARVGDYTLSALHPVATPAVADAKLTLASTQVAQAFGLLEGALRDALADAPGSLGESGIDARLATVGRLRTHFAAVDREVMQIVMARAGRRAGRGTLRVVLDSFTAVFTPRLDGLIAEERQSSLAAQRSMVRLRNRLIALGAVSLFVVMALVTFIFLGIARPLLTRLSAVAGAAHAIGGGRFDTRLVVEGRDELSLLMASFNRMAARLASRERKVVADRDRLTEIIEANTGDLRAANRRLEAIDAARRRFFADVSHELRTPLTVILGESEVTLRAAHNEETVYRGALATIRMRARRLRRRVEDLLRVARSETGQIELELALVTPEAIAAEAIEDVTALARSAGVRLDSSAVAAAGTIRADADWIRQVIGGLIDNAVRHAPPGSSVSITTRETGDAAEIIVTDAGSGVPADVLPHLFERFYRGREADALGYGIGLALAKWVVEQHDGTISIRSPADPSDIAGTAGPGTTVTVRLPLARRRTDDPDRAGGSR